MKDNIYIANDEELIRAIKSDHERGLTLLYQRFKGEFMAVAPRFGGDRDIHTDCYHDAVLAFFEILVDGRYDAAKASIKTLLFTIGKYKILTRLKKQSREPLWEDLEQVRDIVEAGEGDEQKVQLKLALSSVKKLGTKCRKIIELFYYRRMSIAEIAESMGYKNENVVKAHKSRCMKNLKRVVSEEGRSPEN